MTNKALIRRLQISCLGLDPIDPLRLLVDDVVEALRENAMREVQRLGQEIEQEPVAWEQLFHLIDAYVEASAKCDHILGHYAQTEFQIAQAKADLAKARTTFESSIVALLFATPSQRTEQEPVKYSDYEPDGVHHTTPPQRTWVGLTDEEYDEIWRMDLNNKDIMDKTIAKLKEKNMENT